MRRALAALLALGAASAGCDPSYSLHLHAHVTRHGAPEAKAWVMTLDSGRMRKDLARLTGPDGNAEVEFRAFLRNPAFEPVAVAKGAGELVVAIAGRDFVPKRRGFFFVTEWDAQLELELQPQEPVISLRCNQRACTVEAPAAASCSFYELNISEAEAVGNWLQVEVEKKQTQRLSFTARAPGPLAVVALCLQDAAQVAMASNAQVAP